MPHHMAASPVVEYKSTELLDRLGSEESNPFASTGFSSQLLGSLMKL
jgi:hypothetical protein